MMNTNPSSQGVPTTPLSNPAPQPVYTYPQGFDPRNQKSSGSWMGLGIVIVAVWILFFDGWTTLQSWKPAPAAPSRIVQTATALPQPSVVLPSANVTKPNVGTGGVVVVPSEPYKSVPTQAPLPTELPPSIAAQNQATYNLIVATLTPFPAPACDAQHALYITDVIQVLDEKGHPIGNVQGWSCNSEAEAVASVRSQSEVMIMKNKQVHP